MDNNLSQQPQVIYVQQPVQQNPWKQPGRIKGLIFSIVSLNCGISAMTFALIALFMEFIFLMITLGISPSDLSYMLIPTFFAVYYAIFTVIFAVPGIIFGVLAKKIAPFKMASAGVGLSIAGIASAVLSIILGFVTAIF